MLQFLKTWRKFIVLPALLLLSSIIWISNSREERDRNILDRVVVTLTAPFETAGSWVFGGVRHVWYSYFYFVGLRAANDQLLAENDHLRGDIAVTWETRAENERLRHMLDYQKDTPGKLLTAGVIGADAAQFARSLRINRGSRHGVTRNMAVITPSGVLGRVSEVSPFFADVELLTDSRSAVPVRIQRSRAKGVLEGIGSGLCHLKYVARSDDVAPGDVVVTSGLGGTLGIYPRGLVVGTVVSVDKKDFGVLQDVQVKPAVDLTRFPDEVFVVTEMPNTPPPNETVTIAPKTRTTEMPQETATPAATPVHGTGPDE